MKFLGLGKEKPIKNEVEDRDDLESTMEKKEDVADISAQQLLSCDSLILESLQKLYDKIDGVDEKLNHIEKSNRKFMMTAGMQKTQLLEEEIEAQKKKILHLLDLVDVLLGAIHSSEAEDLKKGLNIYTNKMAEMISDFGLEKIYINKGMKFNEKEHKSVDVVHLEDYEDDVLISFVRNGYKDKKTGAIVRYAEVIVNKRKEEE